MKSANTNYRFISKSQAAFKITIPKPLGGYFYRSVGFKKLGEEKALKKAISERDQQGKKLWGKFWKKVVADEKFLLQLPRSLEPKLTVNAERKDVTYEYRASWIVYENGTKTKKEVKYSCNKWGKLGAYSQAKKALQNAYKSKKPLLELMGRWPVTELK